MTHPLERTARDPPTSGIYRTTIYPRLRTPYKQKKNYKGGLTVFKTLLPRTMSSNPNSSNVGSTQEPSSDDTKDAKGRTLKVTMAGGLWTTGSMLEILIPEPSLCVLISASRPLERVINPRRRTGATWRHLLQMEGMARRTSFLCHSRPQKWHRSSWTLRLANIRLASSRIASSRFLKLSTNLLFERRHWATQLPASAVSTYLTLRSRNPPHVLILIAWVIVVDCYSKNAASSEPAATLARYAFQRARTL